ncbi:MAG TPA: divalent metal cation transporter [Tepidisphaeraceae bacterium]|nr:divalent metal cation transporter [Tepidisphaeraceae bacterium]
MNLRKLLEVSLGIVTSIGGFLEAGSIATAAQAGAAFEFRLIWAVILGTSLLVFLIEMSGRLAAVSGHPLPAAIRERFGFNFFVVPLIAETIVDFLVLAAEIGGACVGLQLLTGIAFQWWALPVLVAAWLLLWNGTFGAIEYGVAVLGLITTVFAVAVLELHPNWIEISRQLLPGAPPHHSANYWFLAVSILGATISPYLFNFYSSGAVEDKWTEEDLPENRITAILGMSFGGLLSVAVLICAACVLHPRREIPQSYEQIAEIVSEPLGPAGYYVFGAAIFIACFGAALEISLDIAYVYSQGFGWNWGESKSPHEAARFSLVYTVFLFLAALLPLCGVDPIGLTMFSMAITTVILPLVVLPFIVLLNDQHYMDKYGNGRFANGVVFFAVILASILAMVAIPLEIVGGS